MEITYICNSKDSPGTVDRFGWTVIIDINFVKFVYVYLCSCLNSMKWKKTEFICATARWYWMEMSGILQFANGFALT